MFKTNKININQNISFVTKRKLQELDLEMDRCYKKIVENQEKIEKFELNKTSDKTFYINRLEDSIKYFIQRRDALYVAKEYIEGFSKELQDNIK